MSQNRITEAAIPPAVTILNIGCHKCGRRLVTCNDGCQQRSMNEATIIQVDGISGAYCGVCYLEFLATLGTVPIGPEC